MKEKNKYTIFGEDNFIDKEMIKLSNKINTEIINEVYKGVISINIDVDKQKLEKWLELCGKLENIDKTDLIDFSIKKKFNEKDNIIQDLEQENELLKQKILQLKEIL